MSLNVNDHDVVFRSVNMLNIDPLVPVWTGSGSGVALNPDPIKQNIAASLFNFCLNIFFFVWMEHQDIEFTVNNVFMS